MSIHISAASRFVFYTADGGTGYTLTDTTTTVVANTIYHVVGVNDGNNMYLYVDGKLTASMASALSYSGYGNSFFSLGAIDAAADTFASNILLLLANYSKDVWSSGEVQSRAHSPFSFLPMLDRALEDCKGGGGSGVTSTISQLFSRPSQALTVSLVDVSAAAAQTLLAITQANISFVAPTGAVAQTFTKSNQALTGGANQPVDRFFSWRTD